jgi:cytochrome b561
MVFDIDQSAAGCRGYTLSMQYRNSATGYGAVPMSLHWLTAGLVVVAWLLGTFDDALPKGAARAYGLFAHMSAGLAVLIVLAVRLLWRTFDPPPQFEPSALGTWMDRAAHFAQYALYALMIAAVVSGVVLQFARGDSLPLFGLSEIASPWAADRPFSRNVKEVHELLTNGLVIFAGLHATASLFHHWILRDRTLLRMLPGSERKS